MAHSSEIEKLERRWMDNPTGLTFAPLAEAYRRAGDHARALEVLELGLAQHDAYVPALIVQARCHLDAHLEAQAESSFRAVLQHDAHNLIALKGLADIAEMTERLPEAKGYLDRLLDADPAHAVAAEQRQRVIDRLGPDASSAMVPAAVPPAEASMGAPPSGFETTTVEAEPTPSQATAPEPEIEWTIDRSIEAEMPEVLEPIDPAEPSVLPIDLADAPEPSVPDNAPEEWPAAPPEPPILAVEDTPVPPVDSSPTGDSGSSSTAEAEVEIERTSGPFEDFDPSRWDLPFTDDDVPDQAFEESLTLDAVIQDPAAEPRHRAAPESESSEAGESAAEEETRGAVRVLEEVPADEEPWASWGWGEMPEEEPAVQTVDSSADEGSAPTAGIVEPATLEVEETPGPIEIEAEEGNAGPVAELEAAGDVSDSRADLERLARSAAGAGAAQGPLSEAEPVTVGAISEDDIPAMLGREEANQEPEPGEAEVPAMTMEPDPVWRTAEAEAEAEELPASSGAERLPDVEVPVLVVEQEATANDADGADDLVEVVEGAHDEEPEEVAERQPEIEPELVITETMAEVFLRQGHRPLALAVYAQLLERDPGNVGVAAAVARLRGELLEHSGRAVSGLGGAADNSEEPVGSFLARVLGPASEDRTASSAVEAEAPVEASGPLGGRPTRPAEDASLRLSSIFGDERARRGPPAVGEEPRDENEPSFDEFFGASGGSSVVAGAGGEEADLEQFNAWLRSLQR